MNFRPAAPADGPDMTRLIESHPSGGKIRIVYTRRPDAYQSYQTECANAGIFLCVDGDGRLLAQIACLPRNLYINRKASAAGYVTGLHKAGGARINIMKLLEAGYYSTSSERHFCSILDENQSAYDMFIKRRLIHPICDYATYILSPAAIKPIKHNFGFRRAAFEDTERLLRFYNEVGSGYSYFPAFSSLSDFPELTVSDFFVLEDGDVIIAAGALWNQQKYKQYIVLGYEGAYKFAAACNPLLRALHYPPLPKINEAANFAYIGFMLSRSSSPFHERAFLGELSAAARKYDLLAAGAVKGTALAMYLNTLRQINFGSKICAINFHKCGIVEKTEEPFRFECALLKCVCGALASRMSPYITGN